jgi:6-phosphogluconolactonase (cycloisomerase 2 family)
MPYHVYVSNAGNEWFSHFLMDAASGRLTVQPDLPLDGSPGAVATNAAGDLLFVSLRSLKSFGSYRVDRASGGLSLINTTPLEDGAPYVRTDNTDRFLLAAYYGSGHVSVHGIGADGALSQQPLQWVSTEGHSHSIQTDPSNRFVFVPHTNPANAIYQFRFDAETGTLQANDPAKYQPDTPEGPRHFVFHPHRDIVYSVNEDGSTVSAHHFDPEAGILSGFQVVSTLPPEGAEGNSTAEIEISPDGRFLYASNRGHDSLARFRVEEDGALSLLGHVATEATPRFFALDPTGSFVYVVGEKSGRLTSYRRDVDTGALEFLETHPVGKSPLWITFIEQR